MEVVVVAATGPHEVAARGHVVQFYRHSEELGEWAGGYLSAGVDVCRHHSMVIGDVPVPPAT